MSLNVMEEAGRQLSPPLLHLTASLLITVQGNSLCSTGKQKDGKADSGRGEFQEALTSWKMGRLRVYAASHGPSSPIADTACRPGRGLDLGWEPESLFTGLAPTHR